MTTLELKIPPLLLTLLTGLLMWVLSDQLPASSFSYLSSFVIVFPFFVTGMLFSLLGSYEFRKVRTTVDPRYPHHASTLVIGGVYRLSRNPMYVGFFLMLLGWSIYLAELLALLCLPLFILYMNRFQIAPEERIMREKFGAEYSAYMSQVRRWL